MIPTTRTRPKMIPLVSLVSCYMSHLCGNKHAYASYCNTALYKMSFNDNFQIEAFLNIKLGFGEGVHGRAS